MTRGKWVALAVGLAVIAVLALNGPAVWRVVAYIEERQEGVVLIPDYTARSQELPRNPDYMIITRKRFIWFPGRDYMVLCAWCAETIHEKCPGDKYVLLPKEATPAETYTTCTCPHPSHAEGSE